MMRIDDLPPVEGHEPDDNATLSGSLGAMFGAALLCALFIGAGGLIAWLLMHWTH